MSYGELRNGLGWRLAVCAAAGVGRGDVVAVLLHNSLPFVDLMLGASYLGAIFMPLNWRLAPPEVAYIVGHAGRRFARHRARARATCRAGAGGQGGHARRPA